MAQVNAPNGSNQLMTAEVYRDSSGGMREKARRRPIAETLFVLFMSYPIFLASNEIRGRLTECTNNTHGGEDYDARTLSPDDPGSP